MAKPINPYLVLMLAAVLPGAGHVALRDAARGLAFAFFVVFFSVITYMTAPPDRSFIGRHGRHFRLGPVDPRRLPPCAHPYGHGPEELKGR